MSIRLPHVCRSSGDLVLVFSVTEEFACDCGMCMYLVFILRMVVRRGVDRIAFFWQCGKCKSRALMCRVLGVTCNVLFMRSNYFG